MENRNEKIIRISEEILTNLLEYKKTNQFFTFHLRQQNSSSSKELRLEQGFWFQGSTYIWVSPYKKGDNHNKTKSIGFVIGFDKNLNIRISKVLAYHGEMNIGLDFFYQEVARDWIGGYFKNHDKRYIYDYKHNDIILALNDFLEKDVPKINAIIIKYNLEKDFFISENDFQESLKKINEIKEIESLYKKEIAGNEGAIKSRLKYHKYRERDRVFVKEFKRKNKDIVYCPACNLDINRKYSLKAIDVLHVHHKLPLSHLETIHNKKILENDVFLLCPTCHSIIHKLMSKSKNISEITLENFREKINS